MRKAIVAMGIGGPYERQLAATRPFREAYARRHGWDLVDITKMDPRAMALDGYSTALRCHLQKLLIPDTLRHAYDLILFLEADIIVNPRAPCISEYEPFLPAGTFAAVGCTLPQERKAVFGWRHGHYGPIIAALGQRGITPPAISRSDRYMNGGVELYRPAEVADRWRGLFENNCQTSDENLLNLFEVQEGRVLWLPSEWNQVWLYSKTRHGVTVRGSSVFSKVLNRLYNRYLFRLLPAIEARAFRRRFHYGHFHHIAQEGFKVERLARAVRNVL